MIRKRSSFPSLIDEFLGRDLMDDFFGFTTGINTPAVNIVENKDNFRIEVAAPGLNKDDIRIDLQNNFLTISSEKETEKEEKEEKYMRREFSYSSFKRSFSLPASVNSDKISATHKDGILFIDIPKKEEAKEKPMRLISID